MPGDAVSSGVVSDARESGISGEPVAKGSEASEGPLEGDWIHLVVALIGMRDQSLPRVSEKPCKGLKGFLATREGV